MREEGAGGTPRFYRWTMRSVNSPKFISCYYGNKLLFQTWRKLLVISIQSIALLVVIMDDKRKFERLYIEVPARIKVCSSEDKKDQLIFQTRNVSAGGAFISTKELLPEDTKIQVEIFLLSEEVQELDDADKGNVLIVTGQVARSGPDGMAIRFNEDYDILSVKDFIKKEGS